MFGSKLLTMALKINSKAPDFKLQDADGGEFHLYSKLEGEGLVLIFFPKAFTPGCTREVCGFSDDISFFQQKGIRLVGISHDSPETLNRFQLRYQIPFQLLSDPGRVVCRMYGAVYPFGLLTRRLTCFIRSDKSIRHISDNLLDPGIHLTELREYLLHQQDYAGVSIHDAAEKQVSWKVTK